MLRTLKTGRRQYLPVLLVLSVTPSQALPSDVASLLKRHAGFSSEDVAAVERGDRVVRVIETGCQAEAAFAGATKLPISLANYLRELRAGTLYKPGEVILQFGRFAEIPSASDLSRLHPEGQEDGRDREKQTLISSIHDYEYNGAISTGSLGEQLSRIDLARHFEPLLKRAGYLRERLPAAWDHLTRHPNAARRGSDDFYVWEKLAFGFRPITRVAQISVWEESRQGRREAIVVTKQIYANRYIQASFQIDHLVSDDSDPVNLAVYLITLNYGRSESLEGLTGKLIRPVVLSRTRTLAEKTLDQAKRDLKQDWQGNKYE